MNTSFQFYCIYSHWLAILISCVIADYSRVSLTHLQRISNDVALRIKIKAILVGWSSVFIVSTKFGTSVLLTLYKKFKTVVKCLVPLSNLTFYVYSNAFGLQLNVCIWFNHLGLQLNGCIWMLGLQFNACIGGYIFSSDRLRMR